MAIPSNEAAHRAASDAEQIAWVDEQDQLLGSRVRAELREQGLIGRGTYILLFNSAGELCVHRRTLSKAIYPGFWDVAAGGMVQADESYAESAARELEEELGVSGVPLQAHERFFFDQPGNRLWCAVFSAVWDGPLTLQPEEVLEARFMPVEDVLHEAAHNPYCPDSLAALKRYLEQAVHIQ
ncbi:NUDIX hydrolase [Pseudomonas cannabina]|uniref:MutT/nudix protein n=3 Tax=Pseudomonas syringae group TaxID=136849 RepID=A0A3M3QAL9_PSECA|nr:MULTISPECIES: NUDIX hydrolase [Pseudomonas syringae group]KPB69209.1 MutT/nudix family protein [Pseudomonas syringae pv. maculicola]KPW17186.1 MutT/nudix family protein [Pseudomonas cannabina pv. alisalensis]MBM0139083.1 NUDIX hydrolase [Pseudomonas cannabina pv. alisalensis]QHE99164.1 NUDIX domain-containing protein [Pseudomonas syringae pv. maculicola str. ES4326]QQN21425.1 NUDIX hydrolase [Pseudomonas cannabina pv. alisalensis]